MAGISVFSVQGIVELRKLALFVSGCVLVEDTVANRLIDLLHGDSVSSFGIRLVARLHRRQILLDCGTKLTLEHLVLKRLGFGHLNTLFC